MLQRLPLALALLTGLLPAQEGLRTRKTREAIIKSNASKDVAEAVGQRIDNFCAAFAEFYGELGLEKKSDNKLVARVFDTYEEYEALYRRNNPGEDTPMAYFSPSLNAIVLFDDEADLTLRQTLFHEASHQYLNRYTNDAPKWLNEGLAEFFEGWRMTPQGTVLERRVNLFDLKLLQDSLRSGEFLAPSQLVAFDAEAFKDFRKNHPELHPYLHYVTSWSLVWFSLQLSGDPRDRERFVAYLRDLNRKGPSADFVVDDWSDFEERWKTAILELRCEPVDAMDFVLLATGYREGRDFARAIELYQAALDKDPATPGVAYFMGTCKKRLGDYDGAMEWLAKARTADPTNASVPYLMARIVLGIDRQNARPDPARALTLAEAASELAGGEAPHFLELVARCHAAAGDGAAAARTIRQILKLVEEDEEKAYYEQLGKDLKAK